MMKGISLLLQLVFVFNTSVCSSNLPWQRYARSPEISLSQASSLYSIFTETGMADSSFPLWFNSLSNATTYCDFPGIKCDRDDYVVALDARNRGLYGTIPESIGNLERLSKLQLQGNSLQGNIPMTFSQLSKLVHLDLHANKIAGQFPEFSKNTMLEQLLLSRNAFTGTIPTSLCHLRNLASLDITSNTRLEGSLPSCLSDLSNLKNLRITNVGLVGEVPLGLCRPRQMNGLVNNTFGCDAVACHPGTFHRRNGRQASRDSPCLPCDVPSNVLGSTVCQWVIHVGERKNGTTDSQAEDVPSYVPSAFPSLVPKESKSHHPSYNPIASIAPSRDTSQYSEFEDFASVSPIPYPSNTPTSYNRPTFPLSVATQLPSTFAGNGENSFDPINEGPRMSSDSSDHGFAIGGSLGAFVIVFLTALIVWAKKNQQVYRRQNTALETRSSDALDDVEQINCLPQQSLSTIDEEDSQFGSLFTNTESPNLQSSFDSINAVTPQNGDGAISPQRHRVRFNLPDPILWSSEDSDERENPYLSSALRSSAAYQPDTWTSWMMNPILFSSGLCSENQPARSFETSPDEDEQSCSRSQSSPTSQTPILSKGRSDRSDFCNELEMSSTDHKYTGVYTESHPVAANTSHSPGYLGQQDTLSNEATFHTDAPIRPILLQKRNRVDAFRPRHDSDENWEVGTNPDGMIEI